ncbi:hypothetical protein HK102_008349 [Quaeritorhiza haematococci]|nr:hypothetical protein HK102_008349 [Quaeritorhiza haematococci]
MANDPASDQDLFDDEDEDESIAPIDYIDQVINAHGTRYFVVKFVDIAEKSSIPEDTLAQQAPEKLEEFLKRHNMPGSKKQQTQMDWAETPSLEEKKRRESSESVDDLPLSVRKKLKRESQTPAPVTDAALTRSPEAIDSMRTGTKPAAQPPPSQNAKQSQQIRPTASAAFSSTGRSSMGRDSTGRDSARSDTAKNSSNVVLPNFKLYQGYNKHFEEDDIATVVLTRRIARADKSYDLLTKYGAENRSLRISHMVPAAQLAPRWKRLREFSAVYAVGAPTPKRAAEEQKLLNLRGFFLEPESEKIGIVTWNDALAFCVPAEDTLAAEIFGHEVDSKGTFFYLVLIEYADAPELAPPEARDSLPASGKPLEPLKDSYRNGLICRYTQTNFEKIRKYVDDLKNRKTVAVYAPETRNRTSSDDFVELFKSMGARIVDKTDQVTEIQVVLYCCVTLAPDLNLYRPLLSLNAHDELKPMPLFPKDGIVSFGSDFLLSEDGPVAFKAILEKSEDGKRPLLKSMLKIQWQYGRNFRHFVVLNGSKDEQVLPGYFNGIDVIQRWSRFMQLYMKE